MKNLAAIILLACTASGDVIFSVTDPSPSSATITNTNVNSVSWFMPETMTNVTVTAGVYRQTANNTLIADLSTSVGPGANILQSLLLHNIADNTASNFILFSGLTLGPGTYYLSVTGNQILWDIAGNPTLFLATGVAEGQPLFANSANGTPDYTTPAQSAFVSDSSRHIWAVNGDPVPEPSSISLIAMGFMTGAMVLLCRRSSRVE